MGQTLSEGAISIQICIQSVILNDPKILFIRTIPLLIIECINIPAKLVIIRGHFIYSCRVLIPQWGGVCLSMMTRVGSQIRVLHVRFQILSLVEC